MRYLVVIRPTEIGFSAMCPDVEGCVASGRSREEVEAQIGRVIDFHVCALRREGRAPPVPRAVAVWVDVGEVRPRADRVPGRLRQRPVGGVPDTSARAPGKDQGRL